MAENLVAHARNIPSAGAGLFLRVTKNEMRAPLRTPTRGADAERAHLFSLATQHDLLLPVARPVAEKIYPRPKKDTAHLQSVTD